MLSIATFFIVTLTIFCSITLIEKNFLYLMILIPCFSLILVFTKRKYRLIILLIFTFSFLRVYPELLSISESIIEKTNLNKYTTFTATVSDFSTFDEYPKSFQIHNIEINGKTLKLKARVYSEEQPVPFSKVKITGEIKAINTDIFGKISSISYIVYSKKLQTLKYNPFFSFLSDLRSMIIRNISLSMKSEEALILLSSTVGINTLSQEEKNPYILTGTSHIFAISGIHISVIHSIFRLLFGAFPLLAGFTSITAIGIFILLVGLKMSALRAFFMYIMIILGSFIGRGKNHINFLFISATAIILIWPDAILSLSLVLSFLAMLGLLVLPQYLPGENNNFLISLIKSSFATELMILPVIMYFFNTLPAIAFISNLFAIPAFYVLEPIGMTQVSVSILGIKASEIIAPISNSLFGIFNDTIKAMSKIPFSSIRVESNIILFILLVSCSLLILIFTVVNKKLPITIVTASYLIIMLLYILFPSKAIYTGYTKNEQYCIIKNKHEVILIVVESEDTNTENEKITTKLKKAGVENIDLMIIAHPVNENRWSSGLDLLQDQEFKVEKTFIIQDEDSISIRNAEKIINGTKISFSGYDFTVFENKVQINSEREIINFPESKEYSFYN